MKRNDSQAIQFFPVIRPDQLVMRMIFCGASQDLEHYFTRGSGNVEKYRNPNFQALVMQQPIYEFSHSLYQLGKYDAVVLAIYLTAFAMANNTSNIESRTNTLYALGHHFKALAQLTTVFEKEESELINELENILNKLETVVEHLTAEEHSSSPTTLPAELSYLTALPTLPLDNWVAAFHVFQLGLSETPLANYIGEWIKEFQSNQQALKENVTEENSDSNNHSSEIENTNSFNL